MFVDRTENFLDHQINQETIIYQATETKISGLKKELNSYQVGNIHGVNKYIKVCKTNRAGIIYIHIIKYETIQNFLKRWKDIITQVKIWKYGKYKTRLSLRR